MTSGLRLLLYAATVLAVAAAPQSETARARELIARGEYRRAAEALETLTGTRPGDPEPAYLLGLTLFQLGELDRAAANVARAAQLAPADALACKLLGRIHVVRMAPNGSRRTGTGWAACDRMTR